MADVGDEIKGVEVTSLARADSTAVGDLKQIDSAQLDDAEIFLRQHDYTWDQVDGLLADKSKSTALVKKVDRTLMPLLMVTYGLQLIDKTALSYSAVFDLIPATHLKGTEYSWLATMFYFGYLFWEYPGSFLAQRFRIGKYISIVVIVWGAMLMLTAASHDFAGLMICRFLLGCLEAPITPCFMMIVGSWYDRQSQPFRAGIFYCCNGVFAVIGSIVFYGVGQMSGFPVYKAIFLICGGVTFLWGFVLLWRLPDSVLAAHHFTIEEKVMVMGVGRRNQTGVYNHHIKWYQIKEAFCDIQLWLLFIIMVLNETVNGGFVSFGALIIKGLVHSPLKTTALGIPQGVFTAVFILSGTWVATRFKNCRCLVMGLWLIPSIIASFLDLYLAREHLVGLLFAYYIMSAYCATLTLALQMPAANTGGYTKRVTGTAFVFLGYCLGNIIGPHAFLTAEAPEYPTGCKTLIGCNMGQVGLVALLWYILKRRNAQRDQARAAVPTEMGMDEQSKVLFDRTDFEDPDFRYLY